MVMIIIACLMMLFVSVSTVVIVLKNTSLKSLNFKFGKISFSIENYNKLYTDKKKADAPTSTNK